MNVRLVSDSFLFEHITLTADDAEKAELVIGRSHRADYHIDHPQVSGLQCTLKVDMKPPHKLTLKDTSTNGTFVDGREIGRDKTVELTAGCTVTFLVNTVEEKDLEFGTEIPSFKVELRKPPRRLRDDDFAHPAAAADLAPTRRSTRVAAVAKAKPEAKPAGGRASRKKAVEPVPLLEPAAAAAAAEPSGAGASSTTTGRALRRRGSPLCSPAGRLALAGGKRSRRGGAALLDQMLSYDLLAHILGMLDTRSMLRASAASNRLRESSFYVDAFSLPPLREPLRLSQSSHLLSRFHCLRVLRIGAAALLPDWSGQTAAVVAALLPRLDTLATDRIILSATGANALANALHRAPAGTLALRSLDLTAAQLCVDKSASAKGKWADAGVVKLLDKLRKAPRLEELRLCMNELSARPSRGERIVSAISGLLATPHSCLRALALDGNYLGDASATAIAGALRDGGGARLHELSLSSNFIECKGAEAIAEMVGENTTLRNLNLRWNGIQAVGANALGDAVEANKGLRMLDLSFNSFLLNTVAPSEANDQAKERLTLLAESHAQKKKKKIRPAEILLCN